jgi:hypothetical protein
MSRRLLPALAIVAVTLFLTACSDDEEPPAGPWVAQNLPSGSQGTVLWDVASDGQRIVAVGGQSLTATDVVPVLLHDETEAGSFTRLTPSSIPTKALLTGVTFAADSLVVVGAVFDAFGDPSGAVVLDQRGGWSQHLPSTDGGATCVAGNGAGVLWAGALGSGGATIGSSVPDVWVNNGIFGTSQEAQVNDVTADGTGFFICGWNDAGTPDNFVARRGSVGWDLIPGGPVDDTTDGEYRALLLDGGRLYVAGIEDEGATPSAFLWSYSAIDGWRDEGIPAATAEQMQAINDFVRLPGGDWVFACGESNASLWYWSETDGLLGNEGPNLPGRMTSIALAASGGIYAAGWTAESPSLLADPLLYRRN